MGLKGPGASVLATARRALRNDRTRPSRRRAVASAALEFAWRASRPPDGSRLASFQAAFNRVVALAHDIGIADADIADWQDGLEFVVDDLDAAEIRVRERALRRGESARRGSSGEE